MEGAALAAKQRLDLATFTAWHTAIFALNGYSGGLKNKSLSDFLSRDEKPKAQSVQHARAIAFFHRLQAEGVPVKITRTELN